MLKKFSFKNSYCFQEEVTFDMSTELSPDKTFMDGYPLTVLDSDMSEIVLNCKQGHKYGILPVAAIYGKNASGKTKLLHTLRDIAEDAIGDGFTKAVKLSPDTPFKEMVSNRRFIFTISKSHVLHYSICVVADNYEYTLEYTLSDEGVINEKLTSMPLQYNASPEVLYKRYGIIKSDQTLLSEEIKEHVNLMVQSEEKRLWFSLIAPAYPSLKKVYNWFSFVLKGMTFNDLDINSQKNKFAEIAKIISDENDDKNRGFKKRLIKFLKCLDSSIDDIESRRILEGEYILLVFHNTDSDITIAHLIENESAGTRKLIELFPQIDDALQNGRLFICDELDRMLHPIAFKQLVRMFNSPKYNRKNAQLIFTAHDTIALNSDMLRRDEVHIVDKNEFSVSVVNRLSDFTYVEPHPHMEFDFRTGYYYSFPENFYNSYSVEGDEVELESE